MGAMVRKSGEGVPIVRKSNVLCRGRRWSVTSVFEPRLIAIVASRVQSSDKDLLLYEIPVQELVGSQRRGGKTYETVQQVCRDAMNRVIEIQDDGSKSFHLYHLFDRCSYDEQKHAIYIQLHPDMKPHFVALRQHYTQYRLCEYMALPSIYSQRLYEILRSWESQAAVEIAIEELREMLSVPSSMRRDFGEFRKYVLEKAHADITVHTSLRYNWLPLRKGRKVVAVRFELLAAVGRDGIEAWEAQVELARKAAVCYREHRAGCAEDQPGAVCLRCRKHSAK